jgi:hypothetical protein
MRTCFLWSFLLIALTSVQVFAGEYSGTYTIRSPGESIVLDLQQADDGTVQGWLRGDEGDFRVTGQLEPPGISGRIANEDEQYGFVAEKKADGLYFRFFDFDDSGRPEYTEAETLIFQAAGTASARLAEPAMASGAPGQSLARGSYPTAAGDRQPPSGVIINRVSLEPARRAALEQQYGTHLPDGRFWYDHQSGAWGMEGGPTLGFVAAGLDLPGPMPQDISGGGTGIVINGREIHPQDQMALMSVLGTTIPGSYWLDAQGNLGIQGGGVIVNLVQAAQRSGGGGRGGLVSGAGGTVGTDGSGGVLFYQHNASGGYNSYSN